MAFRIRYSLLHFSSTTNWRPWTLTFPFLLAFVLLCISAIIALEALLRVCRPDGCPVFGTPPDSDEDILWLNPGTSFVYNYLPTILTLGFGLLCAVIHHDCMRMEPWFQLSREKGATAGDSILLKYPYLLPIFVPFVAVKRGHYSVLAASCMLLFTNFGLTPFTSGLFDDTFLRRPITHETAFSPLQWFNTTGEYSDPDFSARYAYLAYTHGWLNGSLPPFTEAGYALASWANVNSTIIKRNDSSSDRSWTGPTILYEADLDCEEAVRTPIIVEGIGTLGYNITPRAGGLYTTIWDSGMADANDTELMTRLEDEIFGFFSIGYQQVQAQFHTGAEYYSLTDPPMWTYYNDENYNSFLENTVYIWASAPPPFKQGTSMLPPKWTAIYCRPRFYSQPVDAKILLPSGTIENITRRGDRTPMLLNQTSLLRDFYSDMRLGNTGSSSSQTTKYMDYFRRQVGFGYLPQKQPDDASQIRRRFGGSAAAPRVQPLYEYSTGIGLPAFALHTQQNGTLHKLFDPENLAEMHRAALKLQFAMLCRDEWLGTIADAPTSITISRDLRVRGFKVNVGWCRGSQAGFALIAGLAVVLIVLGWGRYCALDGEPNSLASALGLLHRSPEVAAQLDSAEFHPMEVVKRMLVGGGGRYRLVLEPGIGPRIEVLQGERSLPVKMREPPPGMEVAYEKQKKWPMSTGSGIFFLVFFLLVLVSMAALYAYDKKNNGIPSPTSPNSFGYKVLFSYLPTLLGIIVEPLLVTVGSHYCMLGPYRALHRGNARSENSLAVDYDKSPPHFQILRSIRAGDLILGGLTISILLSNVLAVALAGMFSPKSALGTLDVSVLGFGEPQFTSGFVNTPALEMHYTLSSNLSGYISRPNWTTTEHYILPFSLPSMNGLETASAATLGFGASISCEYVPSSKISADCCWPSPRQKVKCPTYWTSPGPAYMGTLSVDDPCWPRLKNLTGYDTIELGEAMTWSLPAGDYFALVPDCHNTFFVAWAELPADRVNGPKNISLSYLPNMDSAVLRCTSSEVGVRLTATVDAEGNVLDVQDTVALTPEELGSYYLTRPGDLIQTFLNATARSTWEDTNAELEWFNYHLVTLYPEVVRDISPNITHIPDRDVLPGAFEDVYRRLYAIALRLSSTDVLASSKPPQDVPAVVTVMMERVEVSTPMLIIGGAIVGYTVLLILLLYWGPRAEMDVAHEPTCLVAMWAALYASDVKELCGGVRGKDPGVRVKMVNQAKGRYAYGGFVGLDGRRHVGVFTDPDGGGVSKEQVGLPPPYTPVGQEGSSP